MIPSTRAFVLFVSVFVASSLRAAVAMACGGVFCAVPPTPTDAPEPIDQTAERIIFDVDDGTITAHVLISYVGPADQFAWIVPAPSPPIVADSDVEHFRLLDLASRLTVTYPAPPSCNTGGSGNSASGCFGCGGLAYSDSPSDGGFDTGSTTTDGPVTIFGSGATPTYEYVTLTAEDANDVVTWLRSNNYNVSANMVPAMQPYIDGGMVFLALKLAAEVEASEMKPIAMTYDADAPMIPIVLTAVAAQPLMGIDVFIVGENPFVPSNFEYTRDVDEDLLFVADDVNARYQTNFFEWVARRSDELDGRFWFQQYVGNAPVSTLEGAPEGSTLSRYYTRMSPEHMTTDPAFERDEFEGVFSGRIDLTSRPSQLSCDRFGFDPELAPGACAFNYCGAGAECVVVDGDAACICGASQVSTRIVGPDGTQRAVCAPAENPLGVTAQAAGVGTEFDPCIGVNCGEGTCLVRAGFATCVCTDDAGAVAVADGTVCVPVDPDAQRFGPGAGAESQPDVAKILEERAFRSSLREAGAGLLPLLVALGFVFRSRRRGQAAA